MTKDPYAIRTTIHVGPVQWIFGRDLLSAGIEGREGLVDVTVWPPASRAARPAVC
jgi:hypothetical protein